MRLKEFFGLPREVSVREFIALDLSADPPTGEWVFGRERRSEGMVEGGALATVELKSR